MLAYGNAGKLVLIELSPLSRFKIQDSSVFLHNKKDTEKIINQIYYELQKISNFKQNIWSASQAVIIMKGKFPKKPLVKLT